MNQIFEIDNHKMVYHTLGQSHHPPIIMIHGYTSSHHVWRTTIPHLEQDYYCIMLDLPGYGSSDLLPNGDYHIATQARRVLALADHLDIENFILIGHSMGGQISLYIASILAPERVIGLVNISGVVSPELHPVVENSTFRLVSLAVRFPILAGLARRLRHTKLWSRIQFDSWFERPVNFTHEFWAVDRNMANRPDSHLMWEAGKQAIKGQDMTPHLKHITAPTLTIFGESDRVISPQDKHLADEHIANHELVIIEDCGHFPMYEKPQAYIKPLTECLKLMDRENPALTGFN